MKYFFLSMLGIVILLSCKKADKKSEIVPTSKISKHIDHPLKNETIKFLWRDTKYDPNLKDTLINAIFINQNYLHSITDPERAALGYVATFIGNDCWWDGDKTDDDRSNLDCKIITALGLGYQCSDTHLGFLRKWFSTDKEILAELEHCPTTPYTATIQSTFNEIQLSTKNDTIIVSYKATWFNTRENISETWSETDFFKQTGENLNLIKKDKSESTEISEG